VDPFVRSFQESPPSVVRRIVPDPTATPRKELIMCTPWRIRVVPLGRAVQVPPPSIVRRIVPLPPTAMP
jgi:hypothetical protein